MVLPLPGEPWMKYTPPRRRPPSTIGSRPGIPVGTRAGTDVVSFIAVGLGARQRHHEGRAVPRFAFDRDAPAHRLAQSARDPEAESEPALLRPRPRSLEAVEEMRLHLRRDAGALIAHGQDRGLRRRGGLHPDGLSAAEADRVGEEVPRDLLQPNAI